METIGNLASGIAHDDLQWIEVPDKYCNDCSFIVRTAGYSIEPTAMKGDCLACEDHRHCQENHSQVIMGDFSVLSAGEVAVKRISESENHWVFKSDNPSYNDILLEKEYEDQYPILASLFIISQGQNAVDKCQVPTGHSTRTISLDTDSKTNLVF